jgi:hypothetical protein
MQHNPLQISDLLMQRHFSKTRSILMGKYGQPFHFYPKTPTLKLPPFAPLSLPKIKPLSKIKPPLKNQSDRVGSKSRR